MFECASIFYILAILYGGFLIPRNQLTMWSSTRCCLPHVPPCTHSCCTPSQTVSERDPHVTSSRWEPVRPSCPAECMCRHRPSDVNNCTRTVHTGKTPSVYRSHITASSPVSPYPYISHLPSHLPSHPACDYPIYHGEYYIFNIFEVYL